MKTRSSVRASHGCSNGWLTFQSMEHLPVKSRGAREAGGCSPHTLNYRHLPSSGLKCIFPGFTTCLSLTWQDQVAWEAWGHSESFGTFSVLSRDVFCPDRLQGFLSSLVSNTQNTKYWSLKSLGVCFNCEAMWILLEILSLFLFWISIVSQSPE